MATSTFEPGKDRVSSKSIYWIVGGVLLVALGISYATSNRADRMNQPSTAPTLSEPARDTNTRGSATDNDLGLGTGTGARPNNDMRDSGSNQR